MRTIEGLVQPTSRPTWVNDDGVIRTRLAGLEEDRLNLHGARV